MCKTLFKCFSGIIRTCLCLPRCFCFYNFFFDVFIVNFKQISLLDLLFSVISFILSPEAEVFFIKRCSLKLRNIYWKMPVLGSLSNKVAGLKACNFIRKGPQHRFFLWNLRKFWRTPFLKNICERLLLHVAC